MRHIILGWRPAPDAAPIVTWAFVLEEGPEGRHCLARGIAETERFSNKGGDHVSTTRALRRAGNWLAGGIGLVAAGYAASAAVTWYRHGSAVPGHRDEIDPLLDQFMPEYEVAERHHILVTAPPEITLSAAADTDLQQSAVVRAVRVIPHSLRTCPMCPPTIATLSPQFTPAYAQTTGTCDAT